ncbi:MAG: hypothetical protein JXR61_10655 [Prolixibacteraceae bacterium]|nr:hypothetical protein [Prolixibacteraceae bacterium]
MQKLIPFLILCIFIWFPSVAQKDINAWKNENNIEQQFEVFKKNLNFWDGNYFLNEKQLTDYYRAFADTVAALESAIATNVTTIQELRNELRTTNAELDDTKLELEDSIKNRNSISMFGLNIDKGFYTMLMSLIILTLVILLIVVYYLYKRSNTITVQTKKDYADLKQEFDTHKKDSLDRYTKINMELHHTRLQLNKK